MKRKYTLAILFIAIAFTFCGTATAEEQNTIQDTQLNTNPQTTVNEEITTSSIEDNPIVDTSITTSTENNVQDNQLEANPQTAANDQTTNSLTTQNTLMASTMPNTSDPTPEIIITFDDGFESVYTVAYPIMEQYGIKGTVYINPGWVGAPGYLTQAQLTALHNAGWTIANHSWGHALLPELPKEAVTTEIQTAIDWLNNNGFQDGAYHLAYPYGGYNDTVLEVCSELGIKTARTVNWGTISNDYTNYLELPIILLRSDTPTNAWQSELDNSIAHKNTAIFLLHNIVTGNPIILEDVTVDIFRTIIEYINQTGVKTLTINEWYNYEMDNVAPVPSADLPSGSYNTDLTVKLSATDNIDSNPTIYYTTDGSTPTTNSNLYTGPISLNKEGTTTLKFIAVDYTGNISNVTERTYTIDKKVPTAYANSKGGLYNYDKNVRLYMGEAGTIYYTLNGSTPTTSSTKYTGGPILISSTTTLKFIAVDLTGNLSPVYTEKYTIDKVRPIITSVSIKNGATGVSRTSTIVIKFSKNIKTSFNWNKFYVKNLKTGKLIPISRIISGNTLYIKTSARTANTWYQVYIPGYSVKDSAGNNLAKGYWFKFQTGK
ncbi:chitobiase/beta-hexosaminidase C-terminal domain-containing protein [Methanobacterium oryzae]|uniref:chitobiase/beta-hexosaminidase C-terminal domain-containing protein n=1 Tax=Methanobacterium oryzae TaxID=69540 RepID=UPI003D1A3175